MIQTPKTTVSASSQTRVAVGYIRVSSDEQRTEGFSIPAQRELIRQYAAHHSITLLHEYEETETAKRAGRRAFGAMVAFLKRHGRCRTVLVEKLDRLTRNILDLGTLEGLGIEIHFIKEHQVYSPTSRSSDKLMVGIRTVIAKNYSDNLSEETRKGQREKAAQGLWPSCAPLGYDNVTRDGRRVIAPDPVRGPLITTLFETYATGRYSLKELTRFANDRGLRSRKERRLSKASVHHLLRSRIYTGDFDWDGTTYRGSHSPLVSQELWARVQDILSGRSVTRRRRAKHDFAFSRLITCGHCGCALVGQRQKQRYTYYHCTGYRGKCPERYTPEIVLEHSFSNLVARLRFDVEVIDWAAEALRRSGNDTRADADAAIHRLERLSTPDSNGTSTKCTLEHSFSNLVARIVESRHRLGRGGLAPERQRHPRRRRRSHPSTGGSARPTRTARRRNVHRQVGCSDLGGHVRPEVCGSSP